MTRRVMTILLVPILLLVAPFAVPHPAADVKGATATLQKFLDLNKRQALQTVEAKSLLTGEASERWDSPYWGKLANAPDKVVPLGKDRAVGRVQWYGENEQVTDFYFYLVLQNEWKLEAMRMLSLTGVVEDVYLELKKLPELTAEQEYEVRNAELTLAFDAKLRGWFSENRKRLEKFLKVLPATECGTGYYSKPKCGSDVEAAARKMYLGSVEKHANGDVFITIGGILDNSVGFLFSPKNSPPPISSSEFIWVEPLPGKWYLYRTT